MSAISFALPPKTTVDTAGELLAAVVAPEEGARLELDASEVQSIDGAAVLAIANIAKSAATAGAPVSVQSPTSEFVDAFSDLGLFEDLMRMEFRK
ncbi:MAG: STAS domain-containing protein [Neomegalonema sp.]|nr:STAS domain-containing protein [Neomegalonema sp.]